MEMTKRSRIGWRALCVGAAWATLSACDEAAPRDAAAAQAGPGRIGLEGMEVDVPDFVPYEAEYGSAFGRFFHQVRPFELDGDPKISVLNVIDMPGAVIVDSRALDRETLRLEYLMSPYFAWGQEFVVARFGSSGTDWTRVPLGEAPPVTSSGTSEHGGYFEDIGLSPALAALMPLPDGARFRLPVAQPKRDGTVGTLVADYEVIGRETLALAGGLGCTCWVVEQRRGEEVDRYWVAREPPFVFRRHRDVGGRREHVSDLLSFRTY